MDLRNDTMKVVYPFANVVTKQADFKAGLKEHVAKTASMHLAKLEGHCVGPYLYAAQIQPLTLSRTLSLSLSLSLSPTPAPRQVRR